MERSTLLGMVGVSLAGILLAGLALWSIGRTAPGVDAVPVVSADASPPDEPERASGEQLEDEPERRLAALEAELRQLRRSVADRDSPPAQDPAHVVTWSPPPVEIADAGLEHVFADEKALLTTDPFEGLPPGASQDQVSRRVDSVLNDVDRIAAEYERVAAGVEPEQATQVLDRAAMLYDHLAGTIPMDPPTTGTPDEHEAWRLRHEGVVARVRDEARRLHQAARDEAAVEPPPE